MKRALLISLFVVLFLGCRPIRTTVTSNTDTDTLIIVHDSIVIHPADSAFINAYFECDSLNRVVMNELEVIKGRKVKPVVEYKDQVLYVYVPVDPEFDTLRWIESHTRSNSAINTNTIEQVKVYPKWIIMLAVIGCMALVLIVLKVASKLK